MKAMAQWLVLCGLIGVSVLAGATERQGQPGASDFQAVANALVARGDALVTGYRPEDGESVSEAFSDLYFDDYEGSGLEQKIAMASASTNGKIEALFGALISQTYKNAPKAEVLTAWTALKNELVSAAPHYQPVASGFGSVFIQSLLILLREGFEAILIISALAAVVRREKVSGGDRVVLGATLMAVVASGLTAVALMTVFTLSGPAREAMEGLIMLLAVAVLLYVGGWLFSQREADRWQRYIRDKVTGSLARGSLWALGGAIFLAVYREGAETVLFYQALYGQAAGQGAALWAGIVAAAVLLMLVYWGMTHLSVRLPMKPFFTGTALLIFALAFVFAGNAILELQNAGWVPSTVLNGFPQVSALGIHPTAESLGLQATILALPLLATGWARFRSGMIPSDGDQPAEVLK